MYWWLRVITLACVGGVCAVSFAVTPQEYLAARAQQPVSPLRANAPLAGQLPGLIGATVEVTGTVDEMLSSMAGQLSFNLQTDGGERVPVAMPAGDPVVVEQVRLQVLARVSADGTLLQGVAVLPVDAAPAAPAPAPAQPTPAAPAKPAAPAPKPAPSAQSTLARYIAKVKQLAPRISTTTATKIVTTVLQRAGWYGVDPRLVLAVIAQESRFNPRAVSPVGARGLGQLMPDTARMLGVKDSFDIVQNIDGTIRFLARLLRDFGGNVPYVLSAYNAGPGNVKRFGGIPPFAETKHYVKVITTHYARMRSELL